MIPMLAGMILLAMAPATSAASTSEVPILFNDHHVYATPSELKSGRVLAALVKDGTVLVPLRAMFEQTGATVTYDASSKTVHVSKAGADVSVTVGVPEATINGEKRPLDVPPEMYKGVLVVPLRLISEGMGAYVEWVPDKRTVVVRYVTATPPPAPAPTQAPPTPAPATPTPSPTPVPAMNEIFVAGDYFVAGKTYNEFSAGNRTSGSWAARAAAEFGHFMVGADYSQYRYPHTCVSLTDTSCLVTVIGNNGSTFVPAQTMRDTFTEVHAGYKVFDPRFYVGIGYSFNAYNNGYPNMTGVGYGVEKLPDLDQQISWYGSYYMYPNTRGTYSGLGQSLPIQYSLQTYKVGGTVSFTKGTPIFLEVGYMGNRGNAKANAVTPGYTHNGLYVGLGVNFNSKP